MPRERIRDGHDPSADQSQRYREVIRRLLRDQGSRRSGGRAGIALVSAHPGAGVTYVANTMSGAINGATLHRESARMVNVMANGALEEGPFAGPAPRSSEWASGGREFAPSIDPSKLAVRVDCRQLSQPGAEFGTIVADGLDRGVLSSHTLAGQSVQAVLNGLNIEWGDEPTCQKECLRTIADVFRLVLLDVPSWEESLEIASLAPIVDGVLIVVEADRTTNSQLARLTGAVRDAGGEILGYILNKRSYPIPMALWRMLKMTGLA